LLGYACFGGISGGSGNPDFYMMFGFCSVFGGGDGI